MRTSVALLSATGPSGSVPATRKRWPAFENAKTLILSPVPTTWPVKASRIFRTSSAASGSGSSGAIRIVWAKWTTAGATSTLLFRVTPAFSRVTPSIWSRRRPWYSSGAGMTRAKVVRAPRSAIPPPGTTPSRSMSAGVSRTTPVSTSSRSASPVRKVRRGSVAGASAIARSPGRRASCGRRRWLRGPRALPPPAPARSPRALGTCRWPRRDRALRCRCAPGGSRPFRGDGAGCRFGALGGPGALRTGRARRQLRGARTPPWRRVRAGRRGCALAHPLVIHDQLGAADLLVHEPAAAPGHVVHVANIHVHVLNGMAQLGHHTVATTQPGDVLVLEAADGDGLRDRHRFSALRAGTRHRIPSSGPSRWGGRARVHQHEPACALRIRVYEKRLVSQRRIVLDDRATHRREEIADDLLGLDHAERLARAKAGADSS